MPGLTPFNQEFQTTPTKASILPEGLDFSFAVGGSGGESKETKGKSKASGITGNLSDKVKKLMEDNGVLGGSEQNDSAVIGVISLFSKLMEEGSSEGGEEKSAGKKGGVKKNEAVQDERADEIEEEVEEEVEKEKEKKGAVSSKRNEVFNSLPEGFQSIIASIPALKEAFGFGELDESVVDPVAKLSKSRKLGGGR